MREKVMENVLVISCIVGVFISLLYPVWSK